MGKQMTAEEIAKAAIGIKLYEMLFDTLHGNDKATKKIIDEILNDDEAYKKIRAAFFNANKQKPDLVGFAVEFGLVLTHNETFMSEMEKIMPTDEEVKQADQNVPPGVYERIAAKLGIEYHRPVTSGQLGPK